jgi:hypothetical protein
MARLPWTVTATVARLVMITMGLGCRLGSGPELKSVDRVGGLGQLAEKGVDAVVPAFAPRIRSAADTTTRTMGPTGVCRLVMVDTSGAGWTRRKTLRPRRTVSVGLWLAPGVGT